MFRLKRVFEPPAAADGYRVLIDRLWPRGLKKADVALSEWLIDVAPSAELRGWFGHDPARWSTFAERYRRELSDPERATALNRLRDLERKHGTVTLLYAARDEAHHHGVILLDELTGGKR